MSKKMMKRSLALGALMAFVITGSAMAGNTYWDTNAPTKLDGNAVGTSGEAVDGVYSFSHGIAHGYADGCNNEHNTDKFLHVDLNGYTVSVDTSGIALSDNGNAHCTLGFNIIDTSENRDGKLLLKSNNAGEGAIYGFGNINIGALEATGNAGHALFVQNGLANIYADNMKLKSVNDNVIQVDTVGKLVLGKVDGDSITRIESLTIDASEGERPIRVAGTNNYVKVYADNLEVIGSLAKPNENIKASDGASIVINANSAEIGSGLEAAGFNSKVDVIANKATIKGKVHVTNAGFEFKGNELSIEKQDYYAVRAEFDKSSAVISANTINIESTGVKEADYAAGGLYMASNANLTVKDFTTLNVNVYNKSQAADEGGVALYANNGADVTVQGAKNAVANLYAEGRGTVVALGGKDYDSSDIVMNVDTLNISGKPIDASEARKNSVLAVQQGATYGASTEFTANNLNITNLSEATGTYAIGVQGEDASLTINADTANITGGIKVDKGSLDISNVKDLTLIGLKSGNEEAAIQVNGGSLVVNTADNATLAIKDAKAGDTYKVVSGVGEETALWKDANLAYDRTTMVATSNHDTENKLYTVKYESFNDVTEVTEEIKEQFVEAVGGEDKLAVENLVAEATGQGAIMEETAPGAKEFLAAVSTDAELKPEQKAAVINAAAQLAEAGGNAGTAVSVANNVAGVTTGRMSFGGRGHGGHKGGHGVGLFEEGSGAAVWAQYMHGKDDATDMPMDGGATSYESEYDGIVVGVDFKKVGKFQSGIAFNYGEGDSNGFGSGIKTSSEYDFWGVGYYGNIRNEDTNFIFDVNYAKSDSDVTQKNITGDIEASPETTTWSAGVKVEKLYQNNNVQIVPYTGLRYMSIDTDEYQSNIGGDTLFNYAPERQDIWLLPLGVTIKQEVVNDNGWVVTPKVDLSYIWAFGDTDSNMSVSIPGIAASNDTLGFTVMDDGSFLGLVGVEAKLDDWTFGVSYSYQKGDYAESKKWFVDAKYSF